MHSVEIDALDDVAPALERIAPVVFVDGKDLFRWRVRTAFAVPRLSEVLAGIAAPGGGTSSA